MPTKPAKPLPFPQRLRSLREAAGLSQRALADAARLAPNAVQKIELGTHKNPRRSTLIALAKALGVTLDELAGA